MRTAKIKISKVLLFELIGLNYLDANIDVIEYGMNDLKFSISGNDERLPDKEDYPECNVIVKAIVSHLEEI